MHTTAISSATLLIIHRNCKLKERYSSYKRVKATATGWLLLAANFWTF